MIYMLDSNARSLNQVRDNLAVLKTLFCSILGSIYVFPCDSLLAGFRAPTHSDTSSRLDLAASKSISACSEPFVRLQYGSRGTGNQLCYC